MSEKITASDALALLDEVVEKRGADYVYNNEHITCQNFLVDEDGSITPACIAGHVYANLGFTIDDVGQGTVEDSARQIRAKTDQEFTSTAVVVLSVAQAVQDQGGTWGLARDAAWRVYGTMRNEGFREDV